MDRQADRKNEVPGMHRREIVAAGSSGSRREPTVHPGSRTESDLDGSV